MPSDNLFDRLKYPTCETGRGHEVVSRIAIRAFLVMVVVTLGLSPLPWPSYLVDSARYLQSALAQSVAALLAVCFTVAFVTFQVASSGPTPRAARVILRSPALYTLLAMGGSTILFSLAFLVLIPTPDDLPEDAFLIRLSVSAAATGVLAGFCILVLTVLFFVYALDYLRPETVVEMHTRLLKDQQLMLTDADDPRRLSLEIREELLELVNLGENLIRRDDRRVFSLFMERLSECFGQALQVWDRTQLQQDFELRSLALDVITAYTVYTFTPLIDRVDSLCVEGISQLPAQDVEKKWSQLERDWLSPVFTAAESQLDICLAAETVKPLEMTLSILGYLSNAYKPKFIRSFLPKWGREVASSIQKLDRAAQGAKLEHIRVLMNDLEEIIRLCFVNNVDEKEKLLDAMLLETLDDSGDTAPMFKHWEGPEGPVGVKMQYIDSVRQIFWRALFEVAGPVFDPDLKPWPRWQTKMDYVGYVAKLSDVEVTCGFPKSSFLEDILQDVWREGLRHWRMRDNGPREYTGTQYITFWLWLRIYLAEGLGIWPVRNSAAGSSLDQKLLTVLDQAIENMTMDSSVWFFLTGTDRNAPDSNRVSKQAVNRSLDALSKAIHGGDSTQASEDGA
ncbi:MAG TPA: DUF2254 family protein [bacterium]|nr:DUF2254 family protein [bacterium]